MENCIFCKIIAGEIPCTKIWENETAMAFLDIKPTNSGHLLLIPKEHTENLTTVNPALLADLMAQVPLLGRALLKATACSAFNLGVNSGQTAGQVVPHLHIHLIPRYEGDGLVSWPGRDYVDGELEKVAEALKCALDS